MAAAAGSDGGSRRGGRQSAIVLVYGPDTGLVSERAKAAAEAAVDDPADPFQLVKLDGDAVAADPLRLADEANTRGLFGGRRAIWVKPTGRSLVPALTPVLATPPVDAVVVVEAGDIRKSSPLVTLCQRSPAAAVVACYPDTADQLAAIVDQRLREAGLTVGRPARGLLVSLLGGDRIATRNELDKLVLYAHGRGEVTAEDIEAVVGDVSSLAIDAIIDAAFGGDLPALDGAFRKLQAEGLDAGTVMGFALRHALTLAAARLAVDGGGSPAAAATAIRGLHFKREAQVERQLRLWTSPALVEAVRQCGEAVAAARRQASLAAPAVQKALWTLAGRARRAAAGR